MTVPSIFSATLGLSNSWRITSASFTRDRFLDITVNYTGDCIFTCPCILRRETLRPSDIETWHHENFFGHETLLRVRIPTVECCHCSLFPMERPWSKPGSRFTLAPALSPSGGEGGAG